LLRDICSEKRFCAGDISTKHLPEVYPDGFKGTKLSADEQVHLTAVAASLQAYKEARAHCFTNEKRRETQPDPYGVPFEFICQVCVVDLFFVVNFLLQLADPDKADHFIDYKVSGNFVDGAKNATKVCCLWFYRNFH
jgi:hypothetical protein